MIENYDICTLDYTVKVFQAEKSKFVSFSVENFDLAGKIKFRLSEKHTRFEKIFLILLTLSK